MIENSTIKAVFGGGSRPVVTPPVWRGDRGRKRDLEMQVIKIHAGEAGRPAILGWRDNRFGACDGIDDGGRVIINPVRGRCRMPGGAFTALYTGVALFNGISPELIEDVSAA